MTRAINTADLAPFLKQTDLTSARTIEIEITPSQAQNQAIAGQLGLLALRKVRFQGRLAPLGKRDWRLNATLGATIVQPCVVTLDPVTTRIDEPVERIWRAHVDPIEPMSEVEMPEDTNEEPLGDGIDPGQVLIEVLTLALPLYPRAQNARIEQSTFAAPGTTPMSDEEARPFAVLSGLKDRLGDTDDDTGTQ